MDNFRHELIEHLEELLQSFFAELNLLSQARESEAKQGLVDGLFRNVHSIKGTAATAELDQAVRIAQQVETMLADVRNARLKLTDRLIQALEKAGDLLVSCLTSPPPGKAIVDDLCGQLEQIQNDCIKTSLPLPITVLQEIDSEIRDALTDDQKQRLAPLLVTGGRLYLISPTFEVADFDKQLSHLRQTLQGLGEIISTYASVYPEQSDRVKFRIVFVSLDQIVSPELLARGVPELQNVPIRQVWPTKKQVGMTYPVRVPASAVVSISGHLAELFSLIRETLEVAIKNASGDVREQLVGNAKKIDESIEIVETEVLEMQTVSARQLLMRAERAGRATARACGKEIRFEVVGTQIQLRRTVADGLTDALVHLVRNAVDHGIESAGERATKGKHPQGTIKIEAESDANGVCLRVGDDGSGINTEELSQEAAALDPTTESSALDMDQPLRVIFRPGFSTKPDVTDTSGRGVGLDVVEKSVAAIGGRIRLITARGKGSVFEIRVPNS